MIAKTSNVAEKPSRRTGRTLHMTELWRRRNVGGMTRKMLDKA